MKAKEIRALDFRMRMAIQYGFKVPFESNGRYYTIAQAMDILKQHGKYKDQLLNSLKNKQP